MTMPFRSITPAAPPAGPLDADVVDTSAFPTVLIDFTVPPPLTSRSQSRRTWRPRGGTVVSVAPVDPAGIVVALAVDNGAASRDRGRGEAAQGASIEASARNGGARTESPWRRRAGCGPRSPATATPTSPASPASPPKRPTSCPIPGLILGARHASRRPPETGRHRWPRARAEVGAGRRSRRVARAVVGAGEIRVPCLVGRTRSGLEVRLALAPSWPPEQAGVVPVHPRRSSVGRRGETTADRPSAHRVEANVGGGGPTESSRHVGIDGHATWRRSTSRTSAGELDEHMDRLIGRRSPRQRPPPPVD